MNANVIKTLNYMKRNGIKKAVGLVKERLTAHYGVDYSFTEISDEIRKQQRKESEQWTYRPLISIVVPAYETNAFFLKELLKSVVEQSYDHWELIIADASSSDAVSQVLDSYKSSQIIYKKLEKNAGISENTNQALRYATGEYVGLLDHDDLLTSDALYEMVQVMNQAKTMGIELQMLYSDEDKCNTEGSLYYEPNIKSRFNLDFLLSNNYICHFLLLKTERMKSTGFRAEYDGAQDFDLILRASDGLREEEICHIPKVLYHWRCHDSSTAANPASKYYAYEAGKRAVQDFVNQKQWKATVEDTEHMGFYRIVYQPDILEVRQDVGALGGNVVNQKRKITSGILNEMGICPMKNIPVYYSGPANMYSVSRDAWYGIDARTLLLRRQDIPLYEEIMQIKYVPDLKKRDKAFCNQLDEAIWRQRSTTLCKILTDRGQRVVWDPQIKVYCR